LVEFEWNASKAAANRQKHGEPFERVLDLEWSLAYVIEDTRRDYGEKRYIAYAPMGERLFAVVYSWRGPRRRIISLRKANAREVARYNDAKGEEAKPGRGS